MVERLSTLNKNCSCFQVLPCQGPKAKSPFGWPPGRRPVWGLNSHKGTNCSWGNSTLSSPPLEELRPSLLPREQQMKCSSEGLPRAEGHQQERSQRDRTSGAMCNSFASGSRKFGTYGRDRERSGLVKNQRTEWYRNYQSRKCSGPGF